MKKSTRESGKEDRSVRMANSGYFSHYIEEVALRSWLDNPHTVMLVDDQWFPDLENNTVSGDIPAARIIATAELTGRDSEAGVLSADNPTFTGVANSTPGSIVIRDDVTGYLMLVDSDVNGLNEVIGTTDLELVWNECGIAAL